MAVGGGLFRSCRFSRSTLDNDERRQEINSSHHQLDGGNMPTSKDVVKERLARYRRIRISFIGRKSGKKISIPVWFALEGKKLLLLPMRGSDTQWYKNLCRNPWIRIDARGAAAEFRAVRVTGAKAVKFVIEKFREKHGAKDVKKYYSKLDVAVRVQLT
jgi:hypothetical protein